MPNYYYYLATVLVSLYNGLTLLSLQKTSGAAAEDAGGGQEKKTI